MKGSVGLQQIFPFFLNLPACYGIIFTGTKIEGIVNWEKPIIIFERTTEICTKFTAMAANLHNKKHCDYTVDSLATCLISDRNNLTMAMGLGPEPKWSKWERRGRRVGRTRSPCFEGLGPIPVSFPISHSSSPASRLQTRPFLVMLTQPFP